MESKVLKRGSEGFSGRTWLHHYEWLTYRRRLPVRYVSKFNKELRVREGDLCSVCRDYKDVPLQVCHKVPFKTGIVVFGLTPDWLDSIDNLSLSHIGICNDRVEIPIDSIEQYLKDMGIDTKDSPARREE